VSTGPNSGSRGALDVRVEAAERRHVEPILDAWEALQAHGHDADPRHGLAPGARAWERHRLLDAVFGAFHPWPPAWVALRGDDPEVVGFLTSRIAPPGPTIAPPTAMIDDLWVHPDLRRHGVGRRLVQRWREAARAEGAEAFLVNTLAADEAATAFWKALGFGAWRVELRADG